MQKNTLESPAPWWKFGLAWMVFGGPAIVVVASIVTMYIAVTNPDELVNEDNFIRSNPSLSEIDNAASMAPAGKARNHAQTGVLPAQKGEAEKR